MPKNTIGALLEQTEARLRERGVPEPRVNAEWLVSEAAGVPRPELPLRNSIPVSRVDRMKLARWALARSRRFPLAYVLGTQNFFGLNLSVTKDVLVPRPETEELVQAAIDLMRSRRNQPLRVLDIGTGSGCIALALACALPLARVDALDISRKAIDVAKSNAGRLGLRSRVQFRHNDLFSLRAGRYDLIVSNPPYIPSSRLRKLEPEVKKEPHMALDGGPRGLLAIDAIVNYACTALLPGGRLALEIDETHGRAVKQLLVRAGFDSIEIRKDLQGFDRIALAQTDG